MAEGVALAHADLLPINADASQPCSTFGVHPALSTVQRLYNQGDATFLTNVGPLISPSILAAAPTLD